MTDVAALRRLQLTFQSHINALETLTVQNDTSGEVFGTKLIKLLPAEWQKEWSCSDANDIIDITALLKFVRDQVDAAERYGRWKSQTVKIPQQMTPTTPAKPPPVASQLAIGARSQPASSKYQKKFKAKHTAVKSTNEATGQLHRPRKHKTMHFLWGNPLLHRLSSKP